MQKKKKRLKASKKSIWANFQVHSAPALIFLVDAPQTQQDWQTVI